MFKYTTILLCIALAEVFRRFCKIILQAFTGPLAKVPGPFINKFSDLFWQTAIFQGNQSKVTPKLFAKYGDVVRVAPNEIAICSKNATHKVIAEDDLKKAPFYDDLRVDPRVANLITERDSAAYTLKRRLLSAGFSISYLNGLEPIMQECMQTFVEAIHKKCDEGNGSAVIDFLRLFANLTFDVMSATSFGGSFGLTKSDDSAMRKIFNDQLINGVLHAKLSFLKYVPFVPPKENPEMTEMIEQILSRRRKAMEAGEERKDLLQLFMDTHYAHPDEFTMKHVTEEMRLFMIAGSDTTSATATFITLLLLSNPSKLKLLLEEIDAAFPNVDSDITFATTQNLSYLNACINEGMRSMPITLAGLPRIAEKPVVLDGFEIPEGTLVTAFIDATMHDPRIWSAADQFVPERWLQGKVDRHAFMPFSAGSRNCIGQQFALKELRLILVTLLRKFELSVIEGQSHETRVHIVPTLAQGKYLIDVKPRV